MMSRGKDILVVTESVNGRPTALSFELLALARRLAEAIDGTVSAAVLASAGSDWSAELVARGADRVFALDASSVADRYQVDIWLDGIGKILVSKEPAFVLIGNTAVG